MVERHSCKYLRGCLLICENMFVSNSFKKRWCIWTTKNSWSLRTRPDWKFGKNTFRTKWSDPWQKNCHSEKFNNPNWKILRSCWRTGTLFYQSWKYLRYGRSEKPEAGTSRPPVRILHADRLYEMAEYLQVTEEYLNEALECYSRKYGENLVTIDNYAIRFVPSLQVTEFWKWFFSFKV